MLVDNVLNSHKKIMIPDDVEKGECKYCMMEEGE